MRPVEWPVENLPGQKRLSPASQVGVPLLLQVLPHLCANSINSISCETMLEQKIACLCGTDKQERKYSYHKLAFRHTERNTGLFARA